MNLNQVTLPSLDVSASIEFYVRLGLALIVDASPSYARFHCPDGGATLSVHAVAEHRPGAAGVTVYFECAEVDARYRELVSQGVIFDTPPADQRWLWREARLTDPSGNQLCLFQAGVNRVNPPWRVGGPDAVGEKL